MARAGALPRALTEGLGGPALAPVQDGFEGAPVSLRPGQDPALPDARQRAALAALKGLDDAVDKGLSSLPPEPAELAQSVINRPSPKASAPLRSSHGPSKRPARANNPFDPSSTPSVSPRHFASGSQGAPSPGEASERKLNGVAERTPAASSARLPPDPSTPPSEGSGAPESRASAPGPVTSESAAGSGAPQEPLAPQLNSDEERLRRALDVLSGALDLD